MLDSSPISEPIATDKCRQEERGSTSSSTSKMFSIDSILKKSDDSPSKSDHEKYSSDESVISDTKPDELTLPTKFPVHPEPRRGHPLPLAPLGPSTLPNPSAPSLMYPNPLLWESLAMRQRLLQTQLLQRNLLSNNIENFRLFNEMYSQSAPPMMRSQMNAEN